MVDTIYFVCVTVSNKYQLQSAVWFDTQNQLIKSNVLR